MTPADVERTLVGLLSDIAPDLEPDRIDPYGDLREQLDLDSMDLLRFMIAIRDHLGIEVPEADYGRFVTLADAIAYVHARLG